MTKHHQYAVVIKVMQSAVVKIKKKNLDLFAQGSEIICYYTVQQVVRVTRIMKFIQLFDKIIELRIICPSVVLQILLYYKFSSLSIDPKIILG